MALNDFKKYDKGNSWTKCHGSVVSWLICRRPCKLFFLNGFKSKKIGAYKSDLSKANERAQCFFDLQINLHVMNTFLFICQFNRKFFFGSFKRFKWSLVLTKRIAASGNEIDTTIPIVRANELKDGWRRRERNLRSNQAKSPASKFILRCFILSKNNIFSRKTLLQFKGNEYYL